MVVTLGRLDKIGGSGMRDLGFLIIISADLDGLRRKLFDEAQDAMWFSSSDIVLVLLDGTIKYISSAYLRAWLPGVIGRYADTQSEKADGPRAEPWTTPALILAKGDTAESNLVRVRPVRKCINQL